jgi:hypothetical protein
MHTDTTTKVAGGQVHAGIRVNRCTKGLTTSKLKGGGTPERHQKSERASERAYSRPLRIAELPSAQQQQSASRGSDHVSEFNYPQLMQVAPGAVAQQHVPV